MGGKSKGGNDEMIAFEKQQAEEARQREVERQARLDQGKSAIDALFQGGGFDDTFYNNYRDKSLNFAIPQLEDQYKKARQSATYDLARAGTLRSSVADDTIADLSKQHDIQEGSIKAGADTSAASLRSHIADQQAQALSQLYATEDPNVAANTATSMVNQSTIASPNLQPLGELFKPLVIGAGSLAGSALDNYYINKQLQANNTRPGTATTGSG